MFPASGNVIIPCTLIAANTRMNLFPVSQQLSLTSVPGNVPVQRGGPVVTATMAAAFVFFAGAFVVYDEMSGAVVRNDQHPGVSVRQPEGLVCMVMFHKSCLTVSFSQIFCTMVSLTGPRDIKSNWRTVGPDCLISTTR